MAFSSKSNARCMQVGILVAKFSDSCGVLEA